MKKLFLLLFFSGIIQLSYAQDSIRVTYSQEADTLVKQRFIDRYEHVFMTKVPTRQMLKLGYSGYNDAGFRLGYEFKILPNISLEAAVYTVKNQYAINIVYSNSRDIWATGIVRWYNNMGRRIDKQISSGNFSGSYFGLSYEQSVYQAERVGLYSKEKGRFGLSYGFQSRFFNRGYVDMSVGLLSNAYLRDLRWYDLNERQRNFSPKHFVITTRSSFGYAIGDWKKSWKAPVCEVLVCDEQISGQWKLQIPNITIGLSQQTGNTAIAYERRIGRSAFSVQADVNATASRNSSPYISNINYQAGSGLELRYYYTQKQQIRRGTGGNNLSGQYLAVGANTRLAGYKLKVDVSDRFQGHAWYQAANISWGFQQRLFKRIYIDAALNYSHLLGSYDIYYFPPRTLSARVGFGFTF